MEEKTTETPLRKFRVLVGTHVQNKKSYTKGKIVKSERDLAKLFVGKFVEVGKLPNDEEEPAAEKVKTSKKSSRPSSLED